MNYKIMSKNLIPSAIEQIESMAKVFDKEKIVMMPDYHAGKGCVVGATMQIIDRVCPNYIGVDIGCSVYAYPIDKKDITFDEEKLKELDGIIREYIPSGKDVRSCVKTYTDGWEDNDVKATAEEIIKNLNVKLSNDIVNRAINSIGSLGSGNHFIEVGETDTHYCLFVHTGSRNLGVQVAKYYQNLAIKKCNAQKNDIMKNMLQYVPKQSRQEFIANFKKANPYVENPHAYLVEDDMQNYIYDVRMVQDYADLNRKTIIRTILYHLGLKFNEKSLIKAYHNYIDYDGILRKGAISAHKGDDVLIPINMRDGVIYGKGKGNPEWNYSAPHGAGRVMSRKEAFDNLNMDDFKKSMDGIFTTSVNTKTLDEAPMAYKPMDEIIEAIGDTVEIIDIIKPIYNFKASENDFPKCIFIAGHRVEIFDDIESEVVNDD